MKGYEYMKKIRLLSVLSILITIFILKVIATSMELPFTDVNNFAWYYDEVKTIYDAGIMEGKTSTCFDPIANMSRAEFVTVLCRLSGEDYNGMGNLLGFCDTDKEAWYADYVAWGVETEMVKGLPGNKFAPNQAVSRQEMAVFIDRFISYMNFELSNNAKIDSFGDTDKVADYATDAVETMRQSGIITGDEKGNFNPTNNASRADVATVVTRILPLLDNHGVVTPPDTDRENFDIQNAFLYSDSNWDGLSYRIYIPENYNESDKYPVLLYIGNEAYGTDNISQLNQVSIMFENENSPVYDSIVVVPQAPTSWTESMANNLARLLDFINSKYSTDSERQYIIGGWHGTWTQWHMIQKFPTKLSAAILLNGPALVRYDIGYLKDDINAEMLDMPIHLVYSNDDEETFGPGGSDYGKFVYDSLKNEGASSVYLTDKIGDGSTIYLNFVSKDDISLLEWLFTQRRETK